MTARRREDGRKASSYAWRVAEGGVLVVEDYHAGGRSVTNDAPGVLRDLQEWRPDLLCRVPLVAYRSSVGSWDALRADAHGEFAGYMGLGCATEAEAVARVLALLATR